MEIEKIKDRLQELRKKKGLTQKKMAEILGINPATFSAYESGKSNPSIYVMMDLSEKFGVSLDWLCGNPEKTIKIETRADMINALFQISLKADVCVVDVMKSSELLHGISIRDCNMQSFIEEWGKMLDLFYNGTIDFDLYKLWILSQMKKPDDLDYIINDKVGQNIEKHSEIPEYKKTPTTGRIKQS